MQNLWILSALVWVLCSSSIASAVATEEFNIRHEIVAHELLLTVQERSGTQPVCDLVVQRFEYFKDLQMIDITLVPVEVCPLDAIGPRKAFFRWKLPFNYSAQGKLAVRVNGQVRATIEGTDGNQKIHLGGQL